MPTTIKYLAALAAMVGLAYACAPAGPCTGHEVWPDPCASAPREAGAD